MKHIITFFSLFIAAQLFGQTNFTVYEDLIKSLSRHASTPQMFNLENTSRSRVELTHNLDSIVFTNASSVVTQKQAIQYNENGTTKTIDAFGLDSATSVLRLEGIYSFTYGANDLPTNLLVETLNEETQQFEETIGVTLSYDGQQRVDTVVITSEDPLTGNFGPLIGIKYVYDGDHLVQSRQWIYISLFFSWIPGSFTNFQYDVQDRLIEQQTSVFDFLTQELNLSSRVTYTYNAQSLRDTVKGYNYLEPDWIPFDRSISEYYNNETMASNLYQLHDGNGFVNSILTNYPVENVVDEFPTSTYQWNLLSNIWQVLDSTNNLLNPDLEWSQVAAPSELGILSVLGEIDVSVPFLSDGPVTDESRYFEVDTLSIVLQPAGRDNYYYSLRGSAQVSTVLPDYLSVYPNPAQDQFTISVHQEIKAPYVIYASNGVEKVRGVARQGTNTIQTSSWPQGMYYVIIALEDGRTVAHKQLIQ